MSRIDTTSFANSLMGGLQTGIQLGQNADAQRFARERAGAQDRQTQFGNMLALDAQAMRRQEIESIAAERAAHVTERENQRKATEQSLKFLTADDATFQSNAQAFAEVLKDAPAGLQNAIINRQATLREYETRKAKYESMKAQGAKFDEGAVNYFKDYGIFVPKEDMVKSDREKQDQKDAQDRESLVVDAVRQGVIGWEELPTFSKISNTSLLHSILTQRATAMAKQQAAIAEQQAAAQKQQLEQQSMQAATPALGRYRNGTATDADLIQLKNAGLITASGIEPNKPMEDKSVFARKQIEDIDKELQFVDQQLMEMGVASRARVSDPVTINQDKAKDGAPGTSFWGNKKEATPEYTKTQQLLSRRDQLLQARQQAGTQLVGGQQPSPQNDGLAIRRQFKAANGREPTKYELADLLRQASQGKPQ